jgi:hypothetical protein
MIKVKGGLKEMNKTFVLTTLLGVFVLSILSINVIAEDQGLNVTISEDVVAQISPTTVEFGSVSPGSSDNAASNGPIEFNATGSNTNITIEVANVTGFPFATGLKLDAGSPVGMTWDLTCIPNGDMCTFAGDSTIPTLDVPAGAPAGNAAGTITYTITGPPAP